MNLRIAFEYYAIDNLLDFKGRASRYEYWGGSLVASVLAIVILIPIAIVSWNFYEIASALLGLWLFVANLSAVIRRFHDVGKSGWNYLWVFTVIGVYYVLYLWVQPSVQKDNEWGSPPPHTIEI